MYTHIIRLILASTLFLGSAATAHAYETPGEAFGIPAQGGSNAPVEEIMQEEEQQEGSDDQIPVNTLIPSLNVLDPDDLTREQAEEKNTGVMKAPPRSFQSEVGVGRSLNTPKVTPQENEPPVVVAQPRVRRTAAPAPVQHQAAQPEQSLPGSGAAANGLILASAIITAAFSRRCTFFSHIHG